MKIKLGMEREWAKFVAANSLDGYSKGIVDFATDWANLMEADGEEVDKVAKPCSSKADEKYGITGFMYGAAVSTLCKFWERGEELRQWHNLDVQIRDEGVKANESGGVLNPAILIVRV